MIGEGAIVLHRIDLEAEADIATSHGTHGSRPLYLLSVDGPGPGFAEVTGLPAPAPGDPSIDEVVGCLTGYLLPLLVERSARRGSVGEPWQLRPSLNADRSTSFACHAVEALLLDRWSRATGVDLQEHLAGRGGPVELHRSWLVDAAVGPTPRAGDRIRAKVNPQNLLARADELAERFPGREVALDANGSLADLDEGALGKLCRALAGREQIVLEQPLAHQDIVGHAELRRRGLRVYLDEAVSSLAALRSVARYDAADGVILKPARLGGAIATAQALSECEELGLPAAVGGMLEAELGRAVLRRLAAHPAASIPGDVGPSTEYLASDPTASRSPGASSVAQGAAGFGVDAAEACGLANEVARFPLLLGEPGP